MIYLAMGKHALAKCLSRSQNWLILLRKACPLDLVWGRDALEGFRLYGEMHRFIPVFAHSVGAKITELPVNHHARKFGKANYGLERTIKIILDLVTVKFLLTYSNKPIYLFGGAGAGLIFIAALDLLYLFIRRTLFGVPAFSSPLLQIGVMFFIMGFQSILMGLIAELLARTYHESQQKPTYTLRKTINIAEFKNRRA